MKGYVLKDILGKRFKSQRFGVFEVIGYLNNTSVTVKFVSSGYITTTSLDLVRKGRVIDKMSPSVCGVGVVGQKRVSNNGVKECEYNIWHNLLKRCYSEDYHSRCSTYRECEVSDNFKYYPYFKEWCNKQVGFNAADASGKRFALDKDILVKGNKIYSENTCCFVPQEINGLLINTMYKNREKTIGVCTNNNVEGYYVSCKNDRGILLYEMFTTPEEAFLAYKQAKELHIKEVANKWKDQIDPRVYNALMNYTVEITD